jgi:hypothetical protein
MWNVIIIFRVILAQARIFLGSLTYWEVKNEKAQKAEHRGAEEFSGF